MKRIRILRAATAGEARQSQDYILAEDIVDGVPVNPKLPRRFDNTPNDARPASHDKFWGRPYIETETIEQCDAQYETRTDEWAAEGRRMWYEERRAKWLEAWPSGTRYDVRCLDGGSWDRSSSWGMFATLAEAVACAQTGPSW